jgi:TolA-binding protein
MMRMLNRHPSPRVLGGTLLAAGALVLFSGPAPAKGLDEIQQKVVALKQEAEGLGMSYLKDEALATSVSVEKRVTDGELYFRLGDFQRAAVIFLDIVEEHPDHPAYPNALFMLAESMFHSKDYYGARTRYIEILEHAGQGSYQSYQQPSLARLLEISMKLEDFEGVEQYFSALEGPSAGGADSVISYTKGKYFYFKEDLETALEHFRRIDEGDDYWARSVFFRGVIHALNKDFQGAAGLFEQISQMEAETPEQRKVRDLSRLNLGRIYYETDQLERAAEVYESIPKTSEMFERALYEIAWVYIKMEDPTKAERSLEVLSISNPDSTLIPKAQILRGNLLLRNGEFDEALKVFKNIDKHFGPVKEELETTLAEYEDPEAHFKKLVADNLDFFDTSTFMPPLALKWVESNPATERSLQVVEDLGLCDQVLDENLLIIDKMHLVLQGETKVNAFPVLKSGKSRATQIDNLLTKLEKRLSDYEDELLPESAKAELDALEAQNQDLAGMLDDLPTSPEEMEAREEEAKENYKELLRVLVLQEAKVDQLQAKIVATELYIEGVVKEKTGVVPPDMQAVQTELENQKAALEQYREQIEEIHKLIELGKAKIGIGDKNDKTDAIVRAKFDEYMKKKRALLVKYGVSGSTIDKIEAIHSDIDEIRSILATFGAQVETMALKKTQDLKSELAKEAERLAEYEAQLENLNGEATDVMAKMALMNYLEVKDEFDDLILKADVGIIDVAWSRKEEHRHRVQYLTSERLNKMILLDDEFGTILQEASTDLSLMEEEE